MRIRPPKSPLYPTPHTLAFSFHRWIPQQLTPGSSGVIGGLGGSHLGRGGRPRDITESQKEVVPDHLSFVSHPNFTDPGLRRPGGGGHFNETWLRNIKERKSGKGVRKGRPSPFPQQHPSRVAAPGARRGRCWIQGPGKIQK